MRLIGLIATVSLFSNPTGFHCISGEAQLDASKEGLLEIQVSQEATLDWDNFSIAAGECTRFLQPSSSSTVVNRVTGPFSSQIDGLLESNGNLFLLNPAGVLIGKSAQIHSESFFATAFSLGDQSFSNRKIINEGLIRAKSKIHLAGDVLENRGELFASHISLEGNEVFNYGALDAFDGGEIFLKAERFCTQSGTLLADGGFIEISGKEGFYLGGTIRPGSLEKPGKLLLDPTDIDIGISMTTPPSFSYPPAQMTFDRPGPIAFLNISDLLSQLENGVSVTIQTTPGAGGLGRVRLLSPLVWSQGTSLSIIADEQIQVFADLMNTGNGSLFLTATDDLLVQSTPSITVHVSCAAGNIDIQADNLLVESGGTPAEIAAENGNLSISLSGDLTLLGGMGLETDAFARITGKNLSINAAGSATLLGGTALRNSAEISTRSPEGIVNLQIGDALTLTGGSASNASALLQGGASLLIDVGQDANLTCGMGAEAAIKSAHGFIQLDVGTAMASDLTLLGNETAGPAAILSAGNIALSSSQNISCTLSTLGSQNNLSINATGQTFFGQDSLALSPQTIQINAGSILFDDSTLMGQGALISTGAIVFQNGSELSSPLSLSIQGASLLFNQSILKGIGTHTLQISGAVNFLNSTLFDYPTLSCSAASFTADQSTLYLTQFFPMTSGNFTAQNNSQIKVDALLAGSTGSFTLDSSTFTAGQFALAVSAASSLTNASLAATGPGVFSGGSLTLNGSVIESTNSTLTLAFSGNGSLTQSTLSSLSDGIASFNILSLDQSSLQSLTSSLTLSLMGASSLTNDSQLLAGRTLTVQGTQLNLSDSSLTGLNMILGLANGLSLTMNSQGIVPIFCQINTGTLCSFNLATFKAGQIAITSPTLQLIDSTITAEQSFQIQSQTISLMNSLIKDPNSFIQN